MLQAMPYQIKTPLLGLTNAAHSPLVKLKGFKFGLALVVAWFLFIATTCRLFVDLKKNLCWFYVKRHFRPPLKLKGCWLKAWTLRTASSHCMHECLFYTTKELLLSHPTESISLHNYIQKTPTLTIFTWQQHAAFLSTKYFPWPQNKKQKTKQKEGGGGGGMTTEVMFCCTSGRPYVFDLILSLCRGFWSLIENQRRINKLAGVMHILRAEPVL